MQAQDSSAVTQESAALDQAPSHDIQLAYSGSDTEQAQWVRFGEL